MVTIKTKIVVLSFADNRKPCWKQDRNICLCGEILHFGDPSIGFSADRIVSCFSLENSLL